MPLPEQHLTQEQIEAAQRVETRRAILTCIAKICHAELMLELGEPARAYLRSRGLGEEHLRELQIGLYPPVEEIHLVLIRAGFTADERRGENGLWQALEGYIIFPWSDARGHLLTLYGRWPGKELPFMKDLPGWQHRRMEERTSWAKKPEHERGEWQEPRVPKTIALFGEGTKASPLYFDRAWRTGQRDLVLVEGVLDAAVLHTHGDPRAIACVAAQLSGEQVETLRRYQPTSVTICLDPDGGGRRGTLSCIRHLLASGITAYVAPTLPEGRDPDEFVLAKGLGAWETHLEGAVHALRFMARAILDEHRGDGWTDKGKTEAKQATVAFAAGLSGQQALADLDEFYWPELVKELGVGKRELPKLAAAQRGARLAKQRDAKAKTEGAACSTHRPLSTHPLHHSSRMVGAYTRPGPGGKGPGKQRGHCRFRFLVAGSDLNPRRSSSTPPIACTSCGQAGEALQAAIWGRVLRSVQELALGGVLGASWRDPADGPRTGLITPEGQPRAALTTLQQAAAAIRQAAPWTPDSWVTVPQEQVHHLPEAFVQAQPFYLPLRTNQKQPGATGCTLAPGLNCADVRGCTDLCP